MIRYTLCCVDHATFAQTWSWAARGYVWKKLPAAVVAFPRGPALWDGEWKPFKSAATEPFTETCNASTPSQAD